LNETAVRSTYREFAPDRFPDIVLCRWEQTVSPGSATLRPRIIPDACADIIVSSDGATTLVGPTMREDFPVLAGGAHIRGIRIRTEALASALGMPGSEIRDSQLPLDTVMPRDAAAEIGEAVWRGRHPKRLHPARVDPRVRLAIHRLTTERSVDMASLSDEVNVSPRHLRRLVIEHSGLEPRAINRVARLQRFVREAQRVWPTLSLSSLAAWAGYADQAHLTRELRELTGTTPLALLRERMASM
jgi:AraC-like DNA-binding protein